MDQIHKLQWDKLKAELDLMSVKDPGSIVPLLMQIDELLSDQIDSSNLIRKINFSCYDLMSQCEDLLEMDRILILNEFFFSEKNYQLNPDKSKNAPLISNTFLNRKGDSFNLALSYLHMASHLDLPIYLIQLPNSRLIKWVRSGKNNYIDLHRGGKIISEDDVIEILHDNFPHAELSSNTLHSDLFDIKPAQKVLDQYLNSLIYFYKKHSRTHSHKILLDIQIKIKPDNIKLLSQRALIHKNWGYKKEALKDFKKILSFVNIDDLSPELRIAYYEVNSDEFNQPGITLH